MESSKRSLAKAVSWQMVGLVTMAILGEVFTGSFFAGSELALTSCAIGFVMYVLHERVWAGIRWGLNRASAAASQPVGTAPTGS
ncbi:DUF2061 domain-containing protein [Aurantimonas sp. 22II-16-19i]|uniref:DUF2061 domain-containing protein n=1 Tax=Aurantimonas sp. 22II-16-19i TaxID=1317114 RepID=UPI0009F7B22F|nr:DUF2061 domain-containing protein [Aurantimonas sp. 22II-16-19i]ORE89914.1 hypothetical protein ATO4_22855 [Aurantimonas sp. 22II-16-19i]